MKRDVLDAAAQSLRSERGEMSISAQDGATRVLRDVRAHGRRRRIARMALVQMAAVLIGFGAWAAGSGRLARLVREGVWQDAAHQMPAQGSKPTYRPVTVDPSPPAEPLAAVPLPKPPVAEAPRPKPKRVRTLPPADVLKVPLVAPLAIYRAAHEAHFERKDWDAAVLLWDDYLKSGDVQFSVEARYNRALALVRLGRKQEAALALRPFADGDYGSYRRDEAIRLLQWIERASN